MRVSFKVRAAALCLKLSRSGLYNGKSYSEAQDLVIEQTASWSKYCFDQAANFGTEKQLKIFKATGPFAALLHVLLSLLLMALWAGFKDTSSAG